MNGSEWGLNMQSEIYFSIHMVEFEQHLFVANGEKSKKDWYGPLKQDFVCF